MKKKYRIVYLPVALRDLTEIVEYIRIDSPGAASKFLDEFDTSITRLERFPLSGHIPKDSRLKRLNYRILVIDSYLVFYILKGSKVGIRRILHGKRKYSFLL